ncbi:MAG: hypothetical protein R2867_44900 [Caldilineaceae bacterium]
MDDLYGKKLLYRTSSNSYAIVETKENPKLTMNVLSWISWMFMLTRAECAAPNVHEVRRIERDFFYDAGMHGADWEAICAQYEPWLDHVGHRHDLNFLFGEMIGRIWCRTCLRGRRRYGADR